MIVTQINTQYGNVCFYAKYEFTEKKIEENLNFMKIFINLIFNMFFGIYYIIEREQSICKKKHTHNATNNFPFDYQQFSSVTFFFLRTQRMTKNEREMNDRTRNRYIKKPG